MTYTMFFPNRILYTSRLLSVTTTYAVDLTEHEFLHLKGVLPIPQLGIRNQDRLHEIAAKIVSALGYDFDALGEIDRDTRRIASIATDFDYNLFGEIEIGGFTAGDDGGYKIADGNHRSIALALLLHSGRIEYQPVTAILAVSKDITEDIVYEDTVSVPR